MYKAYSSQYVSGLRYTVIILMITMIAVCGMAVYEIVTTNNKSNAEIEVLRDDVDRLCAERDTYKGMVDSLTDRVGAVRSELAEYKAIESKNPKLFQELRSMSSRGTDTRGTSNRTRVTAYSLAYKDCEKYPWDKGYGITASGEKVRDWYTVAAGPSVPFGTKIFIPEFRDYPNGGVFTVTDRGGAIKDGHIDVFIRDTKVADRFGVRYINTYTLKGGVLGGSKSGGGEDGTIS